MKHESRVQKSLLNAKVGLIFYFLTLIVTFYSRKVFLDCLGADFIGLTGTLNSILSVLNLAEFGVGNSIAYFLYAPIVDGDKHKINEIISVCGYMYRIVGIVILCCGVFISCFFPLWFNNSIFNYSLIYFVFYSILGGALIGYFINYKNQLLFADQKQYLIRGYYQTSNIVKNVLQILIAIYYSNLYLWVVLEFVYSIACCIILNNKIKKEYPWLESNVSIGKKLFKKYQYILLKCKQIVVYSLKNFILNKSDEIFVFAFVSLKMVAFYGNYTMIVGKLTDLIRIPFNGMLASVGNLVAEGNKIRIHNVFWEMLSLVYYVGALVVAGIYYYISPVIAFWLGEEYILNQWIVLLLSLNTLISIGHFGVYFFNNAYGNYHDVWASWAEAGLNVGITMIAAWKLGIIGILLGKFVSSLIFLGIWKPILLYRYGFKTNIIEYIHRVPIFITFIFFYLLIIGFLQMYLPITSNSLKDIIYNISLCYLPATILFTILYFIFAPGASFVRHRIETRFSKTCSS